MALLPDARSSSDGDIIGPQRVLLSHQLDPRRSKQENISNSCMDANGSAGNFTLCLDYNGATIIRRRTSRRYTLSESASNGLSPCDAFHVLSFLGGICCQCPQSMGSMG